jgi:hypothetical protein
MEASDFIDELILQGAVEAAGVHEDTGEILYSFTPKMKEIAPELASKVEDHFHSVVMSLWTKGFLDINLDSNDPDVKLTMLFMQEDLVKELSPLEQMVLKNIVLSFASDN